MTLVRALAALALAAAPLAAADAHDPVLERNLAWLAEFAGLEPAPDAPARTVSVAGVSESSAREALLALAERALDVDLSTLSLVPATPGQPQVGDVWVIEHGEAPCPAPVAYTPTPVPPMYLGGGMWIYEGGAGASETTQSFDGVMFSWTLKTSVSYGDGGHRFAGQSDFFCVEIGDRRISFPFLDGVAWANQA